MKRLHVFLAAFCLTVPALAQEEPAAGSLNLSDILTKVEDGGARTVYSAEFHRRVWEVVSCQGRERICREELIDATTGTTRTSEPETVLLLPPAGAMPASAIAAQVEKLGIGRIIEMGFDARSWEVEVRNGLRRAEFRIDPMTGDVWRCEGTLCR